MDPQHEFRLRMTRRQFFGRTSMGIGVPALASLLAPGAFAANEGINPKTGGLPDLPHFAPKAKRVIFLHQSGAPSQIELFDYKPKLRELHGTELPDTVRRGQRITGMTSGQSSFPVAAPIFKFEQHGQAGTWISELLPHTAKIVDDIAIIKTMNTDAINHDPAITFIQTGSQQPGRPSLGAWVSYGLGREIETRIAQYEMAYRMQTSVPSLMDLSNEPDHIFEMYGPDSRKPGTYAANCLLARRLAERDVRFIQLYHRGWDQHGDLPRDIALQCKGVDQASAALVQDLKQRGLLDDTLVVWGGEFGRTVYCQGKLTETNYGRDHHPRCFAMWLAGGGVKRGISLGETDDYCYNIVQDPVHIHDLQATVLHCMGIDHKKLTYKFQGRHFRLTDIAGELVTKVLA